MQAACLFQPCACLQSVRLAAALEDQQSSHSNDELVSAIEGQSHYRRSSERLSFSSFPCHVLSRPIIAAIPEANYTLESVTSIVGRFSLQSPSPSSLAAD